MSEHDIEPPPGGWEAHEQRKKDLRQFDRALRACFSAINAGESQNHRIDMKRANAAVDRIEDEQVHDAGVLLMHRTELLIRGGDVSDE